MKIAIAINTSWNIYNFRKGLIHKLLERGDSVVAIAPKDEYTDKLVDLGCSFRHIDVKASGLNPLEEFRFLLAFKKILKEEKPDVLLTYTIKPNIYGSIAAKSFNIPCICNVSGLGTVFLWKGSVKTIAVGLYNYAFSRTSWIFFQNGDDQKDFLEAVNIDPGKTDLLPGSGVNTEIFKPVKVDRNPKPVFLVIARLLIDKGIYEYIEAIKILHKKGVNAEFRLIGGLDESHSRSVKKAELAEWIDQGLIDYTPHLTDVRDAIALADVMVLPSYREGTPRTLLEGAAMGKPLIATDVPGCKHVLIDGENGFLCKVKSPADLAAKMKLFLALNENERAVMSQNARKSVIERFDENLVIDKYLGKIDELS
ncbi:MAG: glycosyltransferase family 4 protein [Marinoscillum sp.]